MVLYTGDMLIIRPSQMESLRAAAAANFAARLEQHFISAGHCGNLQDTIAYAQSVAADFGLGAERDMVRFVELLLARSVRSQQALDLPRPALSILYRHGADPQDKLDRFEHWMRECER